MSSASKHSNKKISSPYNKSMAENEFNGYHSHNSNKLQMNDSALNTPINQKILKKIKIKFPKLPITPDITQAINTIKIQKQINQR